MIKKLVVVIVLVMLALSACSGQASVGTATPISTEAPVATELVSVTEASAPVETLTAPPVETLRHRDLSYIPNHLCHRRHTVSHQSPGLHQQRLLCY